MMATPNSQSPGVRTHFKTDEGRYNLSHEKTHPPGVIHYNQNKNTNTQVTLANLKDKPAHAPPTSAPSSGGYAVRFSASRLLGTGNGGRGLGFGGGNGLASRLSGGNKGTAASSTGLGLNNGPLGSSYDAEGTYILFNVGDTLFISDYNTHDKDPIKCLQFGAPPMSHTFDPESKDGHDLLVGLMSGDVYSASLRHQLQDPGKKIVGAVHYNKDGSINSRCRCTTLAWVPHGEGHFVSSHADGNLYIYDKNKDGSGDVSFPPVRDQSIFSVAHARSSKSNPIARWHICNGAINGVAFSPNGLYLASVGRDGYLRVFDYAKELFICGCKSYFGSLLCCAWSPDSKYVLAGGEDDLVQVWSMEDQRIVAWGEGHSSWISSVAFDPHWTPVRSVEPSTYRFGSVGQDTQLLLWDLVTEDVVVPFRKLVGNSSGSPVYAAEAQSARWEGVAHLGTLLPCPARKEVPKLVPVMAHRVHSEPLAGLVFAKEAILTSCNEGHVKIWDRPPRQGDSAESNPDVAVANTKEKQPLVKSGLSQFKQ